MKQATKSTTESSVPAMDLEAILRDRFGFDAFRAGQRQAIESILRGESLLSIQPTGHGKSLLYQLPAAVLGGLTLVISPLLALMRDQLGHLRHRFRLEAASINSDQDEDENEAALQAARTGKLSVLFVAPEQIDHAGRFQAFLELDLALVVVDEAHCISSWGHDFRPAYRGIVRFVSAATGRHPSLRVLGLTATADGRTEADIREQLEGGGALRVAVQRASMDRPNLALAVVPLTGLARKLEYIRQLLPKIPGASLIYCATRENTEITALFLERHGLNVAAYHAGMESPLKRERQRDFLGGRYQAIAATNALGMGIDKSDLRAVIHFDLPGSVTAYYQEVGRAGRDGKPARGVLLFDPADRSVHDYFIRSAQPSPAHFAQVTQAVKAAEADPGAEVLGITAIRVATGLPPTLVSVVVSELVEQGLLRREMAGRKQVYRLAETARAPDLSRYENQLRTRTRDLEAMFAYGRLEPGCLLRALRRALGDGEAEECGRCSVCTGRASSIALNEEAVAAAEDWLLSRPVAIPESHRNGMAEGRAALSVELRPRECALFLQQRSDPSGAGPELSAFLNDRVEGALAELSSRHWFAAVVPVPSRRWAGRLATSQAVARLLKVPSLHEVLTWREEPPAFQADLLNNDQRRHNVDKRMTWTRSSHPPAGPILLLDDFTGSGATLREAARVLTKEAGCTGPLVPFTIISLRWRLGAPGVARVELPSKCPRTGADP